MNSLENANETEFLEVLGKHFPLFEDEKESVSDSDKESNYSEEDSQHSLASKSETGSESLEDNVILEHALKHRSFFETARKRRQRHLLNRKNGSAPFLNFNGSLNTHYWSQYGILPDEKCPSGNVLGINTIFSEDEFKKFGPFERRMHVNGQKFKVVSNQPMSCTLYRAIAHALGLEDHVTVRETILEEILKEWDLFSKEICRFILFKGKGEFNPRRCTTQLVMQVYKALTATVEPPSELELTAAALHFGFIYSIMEVTDMDSLVTVQTCSNDRVIENGTVKYHFLKCSSPGDATSYEFMLPIGPLKKIQDGQYPLILRDVCLLDIMISASVLQKFPSLSDVQENRPLLGPIPVGFALDHRIFFHRSTVSHDLWSLLAELLYGKLDEAPSIKHKIVNSKHNFAFYYLACKAKKRKQVKGSALIQKLVDDFSERFTIEDSRGDIEDLAQAAAYFDFSYTLIGMDVRGNFFRKDRVSSHGSHGKGGLYLAFFVRTTPDKQTFWFALEDVGRNCVKERKLYADVQSGELRHWEGRFYFRYVPSKYQKSVKDSTYSIDMVENNSKNLVATELKPPSISTVRKLRSSISNSLSATIRRTKSLLERFASFLRWATNRNVITPDNASQSKPNNKDIQSLFVRDQP